MKRITAITMLATVSLLFMGTPSWATPTVTLVPAEGPSGTTVMVHACGWGENVGGGGGVVAFPGYFSFRAKVGGQVASPHIASVYCQSVLHGFGQGTNAPAIPVRIEGPPGSQVAVAVEAFTSAGLDSTVTALFKITGGISPSTGNVSPGQPSSPAQIETAGPTVTISPDHGPSGTVTQVSACGATYVVHPPYPEFSVSVDGTIKARIVGQRGCFPSVNIFGFGPSTASAPAQMVTIEGPPGKHIVRVEARTPNAPPQIAEATFTITSSTPIAPGTVPPQYGLQRERAVGIIAQLRIRAATLPEGTAGPFPDAQAAVQLTGSNPNWYGLYLRGDATTAAGNQVVQTLREAFLQNIAVEIWYQPVPNQPGGVILEVVLRRK